ncbi:unnamed protein product [Parnassius apollo]|uniref:(apollo) hypothetical protein n=1 Tax=Parnassius apollo TaxID=110799 RepID=A0A8S3Y1E0_PARAO|nr:unnamed protein product [Parnassius apollo]
MSSRARKILGLIVENTMQDNKNTIGDYNLIENCKNSNKDFNHEVQNETSESIEMKDKIDPKGKNMIAKSVVDSLDKRIEASISKSRFKNSQCNKSLVPYYDSDISFSGQ